MTFKTENCSFELLNLAFNPQNSKEENEWPERPVGKQFKRRNTYKQLVVDGSKPPNNTSWNDR